MHPPSLFLKAFSRAASEEYLLNDRQGVQGGSSLIEYRGCIVIILLLTGRAVWLPLCDKWYPEYPRHQ